VTPPEESNSKHALESLVTQKGFESFNPCMGFRFVICDDCVVVELIEKGG
jgi:hypothetical protein